MFTLSTSCLTSTEDRTYVNAACVGPKGPQLFPLFYIAPHRADPNRRVIKAPVIVSRRVVRTATSFGGVTLGENKRGHRYNIWEISNDEAALLTANLDAAGVVALTSHLLTQTPDPEPKAETVYAEDDNDGEDGDGSDEDDEHDLGDGD